MDKPFLKKKLTVENHNRTDFFLNGEMYLSTGGHKNIRAGPTFAVLVWTVLLWKKLETLQRRLLIFK